jgi:hypothetical protein
MSFRFSAGNGSVIEIPIVADLSQIKNEWKEIDAVVNASTKNMVVKTNTAAGGMGSAFSKAAKELQQSPLISELETVSSLFIQVGGNVSRVASIVTSSIRPLATMNEMMKAMGVSALQLGAPVAVAGGFAAVAFGAKMLADTGVEAANALDKMGVTVDPEAQAKLKAYTAAQSDLSRAMNELKVAVGSELAEPLAVIIHGFADLVDAFRGVREQAEWARSVFDDFHRAFVALTTLGLSELTRAWYDEEAANQAANREAETTIWQSALVVGALTAEKEALLDVIEGKRQQRLADEADAEAKRLAAEATRKAAEAQRVLLAEIASTIAEGSKLHTMYLQAQDDLNDLRLAADNFMDSEFFGEGYQNQIKAMQDATDQAFDDWSDKMAQRRMIYAQLTADAAGDISSLTGHIVDAYQTRIDAGEKLTAAEIESANAARAASVAFALIQAGIASALVGINTYAQLTSVMVPAPAAAAIATVTAGLAYASAATGIVMGTPPVFESNDRGYDGNPNNNDPDSAAEMEDVDDNYKDDGKSPSDRANEIRDAASRSRGGGMTAVFDLGRQRLEIRQSSRYGKGRRNG